MSKNTTRDVFVAGLMLFATYLGAANLIFPPYIGVLTGQNWFIAAIGFLITGVGLPMLGLVALGMRDCDPNAISRRSWPWIAKLLNVIILIMIGPLFAIPRTAATTCEMSIFPFIPNGVDGKTIYIIASAIYFVLTYLITRKSADGLDKIGKILSPTLITFLFITIIISLLKPIGKPGIGAEQQQLLYFGVRNGYQTMDGLGSIVIGGTAVAFFLDKGYKKTEIDKLLPYSTLISGILMGLVYLGFIWLGASGGEQLSQYTSQHTLLLSNGMKLLAGNIGQILLATIAFFACLTTSCGLTIAFVEYFYDFFNEKLSKGFLTIFCVTMSFVISLIGVEGIINLAGPILDAIYPVIISLIILNVCDSFIKKDIIIKGALLGVIVLTPFLLLRNYAFSKSFADNIINMLPLGKDGFGYIFTAFIGMLIAWIISLFSGNKATQNN